MCNCGVCRTCKKRVYAKLWRKKNPEKAREASRKQYAKNRKRQKTIRAERTEYKIQNLCQMTIPQIEKAIKESRFV